MENKKSKYQYNLPAKRRRKGQQGGTRAKNGERKDVKSVMFVPYTAHSELATRLRDNEEQMQGMTLYRLKIVEKVGTNLVDLLHKANPWAGEDYKRFAVPHKARERAAEQPRLPQEELCVPNILQNLQQEAGQGDRIQDQGDGREEDSRGEKKGKLIHLHWRD